jgi:hypothetical protein
MPDALNMIQEAGTSRVRNQNMRPVLDFMESMCSSAVENFIHQMVVVEAIELGF